jgi:hypothetical protein
VADTSANLTNIKPNKWFNVGMVKARLDETLKQFKNGKDPAPFELEIEDTDLQIWVRFKIDPKRFSPKIFEGEWAFTTQHPEIGKIRVIKAITGEDGIARLIARQGRFIYAYPWFE